MTVDVHDDADLVDRVRRRIEEPATAPVPHRARRTRTCAAGSTSAWPSRLAGRNVR